VPPWLGAAAHARAPPRSRFLGSTDAGVLYWRSPSGDVIRSITANPVEPLARPGMLGRLFDCHLSGGSVMGLLVLVASLSVGLTTWRADAVGSLSLIGDGRPPHDPGAFLSRMGFLGGRGAAIWFRQSSPSLLSSLHCFISFHPLSLTG
jgi:hypothetical protein